MITCIIRSVLFWIAAVVISFMNGLGYSRDQLKYRRNIFGKLKSEMNWRDELLGFCIFGLPVILISIGVSIFG